MPLGIFHIIIHSKTVQCYTSGSAQSQLQHYCLIDSLTLFSSLSKFISSPQTLPLHYIFTQKHNKSFPGHRGS